VALRTLVTPGKSIAQRSPIMESQPLNIRILSHNIRYATQRLEKGEKPWTTRCPRLCAELQFNSLNPATTFICLQEVLQSQLEDVHTYLNDSADSSSSWDYIGVGRDDGKNAGEFSPIYYRPEVWKLENWKTVWLSETPERPSRGWDAALPRIVTVGFFKNQRSQQRVVMMNTHFDHQGQKARANSAKLLLTLVEEYQIAEGSQKPLPVFLSGDFNSTPNEEAYKIMTAPDSIMTDVSTCIPQEKRYGHQLTFTSFGEYRPGIIDFIFTNKTEACIQKTYGVLENKFDDGIYISDHRAVIADFTLVNQ
jgi:endonuclease/exonuclease/phosphatase family metal-dependent hydrolase